MSRQRGFTLLELMIAITLVAALSTGMLMAMRAGLQTLEKTNNRLVSNRRVLSVEQILQHQISNAMPALGFCGTAAGGVGPAAPVFQGTAQTLLLVSSYSMTEGARGYPRVLVLQVLPADQGVRLIVNESLYTGPLSTAPFCMGGLALPAQPTPQSFVLADHLASCRFVYEIADPESPKGAGWAVAWNKPLLPYAVRVEMVPLAPDAAHLPLLTVTARIPVTRDPTLTYDDSW
jgi:general secretion pathway protein J